MDVELISMSTSNVTHFGKRNIGASEFGWGGGLTPKGQEDEQYSGKTPPMTADPALQRLADAIAERDG